MLIMTASAPASCKRAAKAEDTLTVALFAQAGFARAQHNEFRPLKIELAGFVRGEHAVVGAVRSAGTSAIGAAKEQAGMQHGIVARPAKTNLAPGLGGRRMIFEEETVSGDVHDARAAHALKRSLESAIAGIERGLPPGLAEHLVDRCNFGLSARKRRKWTTREVDGAR